MHPALVITLAAAAALPLGLWLRHDLNKLQYRSADEQDLPHPGARWWVVWAAVLAAIAISTAAVLIDDPMRYLPLVPLALSGPWLAAVDFDVLRIANRVLAPTAAISLLTIVGMAAAAQDWRTLIVPVGSALMTGGVFAALHLAAKGGIGFGDVKLAAVIGLAVGPLGIAAVWLSVLYAAVLGLVWTKATRRVGPIPYGPWLLCGAGLAALLHAVAGG